MQNDAFIRFRGNPIKKTRKEQVIKYTPGKGRKIGWLDAYLKQIKVVISTTETYIFMSLNDKSFNISYTDNNNTDSMQNI